MPPSESSTSNPPPIPATTAQSSITNPTPPSRGNLRGWWNSFLFTQKVNQRVREQQKANVEHTVFGKPLRESLKYASVQISTANANGDLYVWGYIPVVVAKCGLYLKENATEVEGTFRVNGSTKRMRDLQAEFEKPPRFGKNLDWKKENYNTHDVASVFRRYLTQMPEPVIPHELYHGFRRALAKKPYNQEEVIATFKSLIGSMPRPNQYLLLYVLDLLSVFARKCEKNLMTATNLAVIFRPGIISHPDHEMSPQEHQLSQDVLEFMIAHQDWFMLDIPPPPSSSTPGGTVAAEDVMMAPSSDEDQTSGGGWKLAGLRRKVSRRRTVENADALAKEVSKLVKEDKDKDKPLQSVAENSSTPGASNSNSGPDNEAAATTTVGATGVVRSRTLPSSKEKPRVSSDSDRSKLRKSKRESNNKYPVVEAPA